MANEYEESLALQLRAVGIEHEREYVFMPGRKWRADFRIGVFLVEVEGGIWRKGGGAHSRPSKIITDIERQNAAVRLGFRPLRVTTDMVNNGEALKLIEDCIEGRRLELEEWRSNR